MTTDLLLQDLFSFSIIIFVFRINTAFNAAKVGKIPRKTQISRLLKSLYSHIAFSHQRTKAMIAGLFCTFASDFS